MVTLLGLLAVVVFFPNTGDYLQSRPQGRRQAVVFGLMFVVAVVFLRDVYLSEQRITEFLYWQF